MRLTDRQPRGWLRRGLRLPILIYRARLGALLGSRFLYLAHRGRHTGMRRETVLEVVRHHWVPPEVVVVAAWGPRSDWYRNLLAGPALEVRIGPRRWRHPEHRFLGATETLQVLRSYQQAHPHAWKRLAPILGLPADPADPGWSETATRVHAVAFTPTPEKPRSVAGRSECTDGA